MGGLGGLFTIENKTEGKDKTRNVVHYKNIALCPVTFSQPQCSAVHGLVTFFHVCVCKKTVEHSGEHFTMLLRIKRHTRQPTKTSRERHSFKVRRTEVTKGYYVKWFLERSPERPGAKGVDTAPQTIGECSAAVQRERLRRSDRLSRRRRHDALEQDKIFLFSASTPRFELATTPSRRL